MVVDNMIAFEKITYIDWKGILTYKLKTYLNTLKNLNLNKNKKTMESDILKKIIKNKTDEVSAIETIIKKIEEVNKTDEKNSKIVEVWYVNDEEIRLVSVDNDTSNRFDLKQVSKTKKETIIKGVKSYCENTIVNGEKICFVEKVI